MEFKTLIQQALEVRAKYADYETQTYGREWTREELVLGFMKDVGDLARLAQAKEGVRSVENVDAALAHELADCLWSIIVLADKYGVDLEAAFRQTMNELDTQLSSDRASH